MLPDTTESNPKPLSSLASNPARRRLSTSAVVTMNTPRSRGGLVPTGTGPSRIFMTGCGSLMLHLATSCSARARSVAKPDASTSFALYPIPERCPAKGKNLAPKLARVSCPILRHAIPSLIFTRAIRSSSVALFASAAARIAFAASAVAPATRAWAWAADSLALAISSRKPSALEFASAECCSARATLSSALAARSCCFPSSWRQSVPYRIA